MKPKDLYESTVFCSAPWNNLYVGPDGRILTCSIGRCDIGNLHNDDVQDVVVDNTVLKDIQQSMIDGVRHKNCGNCYELEDSGVSYSLRKHYKKTITKFEDLYMYDVASGNIDVTGFDLRYDNTCQNACVYCEPELSSRWEKELGIQVPKPNQNKIENTKKYVSENLSDLKEIYLAGGEPLVTKDFAILLQELYEVNPDCKVRINSNIKNIDTPVYELSKKFRNLQYTISAEAVGLEFDYIRYPQKWTSFKTNVVRVMDEVPQYNFNMALNVLNVYGLFDCIDYLRSVGAHDNSFIITHVNAPSWNNINNLSDEMLVEFVRRCRLYMSNTDPKHSLYSALEGCINFVQLPFVKNIDDTIDNLQILDKRRNLDSNIFSYIYKS
jgi:radical SAM protein with 4Fe4S-binding SPASM domain